MYWTENFYIYSQACITDFSSLDTGFDFIIESGRRKNPWKHKPYENHNLFFYNGSYNQKATPASFRNWLYRRRLDSNHTVPYGVCFSMADTKGKKEVII